MTDNGTIWADKFVKREQLPAGELAQRFNINNPRSHPEAQREATESSLDTIGWIDEISLSTNGDGPPSLADNPAAVMFDGHERVEIALVRGGVDTLVPVRWYQLTPEETDFALLVKDQSAAMAQIVPEKMAALMERAKAMTSAPGLQGLMERLRTIHGIGVNGGSWDDAFGGLPNSDRSPFQQMTFTLHDSQVEMIKEALVIAKQKTEFDEMPNENSNGNALTFICEQFLNDNG